MPIGAIWQTFLETPLINFMVLLSVLSFGSYGVAILVFTLISRIVTFPLTLKTLHSAKAMQELQPKLQEIQKKYSDPRRRSEEQMKLYKEHGVNPLGCVGPMVVQLPIFFALYAAIRITLGSTPENVLYLSSRLYDWDLIRNAVPLEQSFLGMDLGENGNIVLAVITFAAMWLQQRISSSRRQIRDPQQQQMYFLTQWFMPVFFGGFLVLTFPAGLGVYWAASTIVGIALQWIFVGPGDFTWRSLIPRTPWTPWRMAPRTAVSNRPANAAPRGDTETRDTDASTSSGTQRQDRRRSRRAGARATRPQSRSSRRRRNSGG